jgi:hypothetical protein
MNFIRSILPPYIVPIMPEMSLIDEPVMYPYSQDVLPKTESIKVALERFKLIDVSWVMKNRTQLDHTRYYFGYVGVSQNDMLFGRSVFTGYVLLESHYDEEIEDYAEPDEMWGLYLWSYRGRLSNTSKNELFLKMLWRHWTNKKKQDKKLGFCRNLHSVHFYKEERLLSNQLREIARRVWA